MKTRDIDPDEMIELCNWDLDSQFDLAEKFIERMKLFDEYQAFLEQTAREELLECGELDEDGRLIEEEEEDE